MNKHSVYLAIVMILVAVANGLIWNDFPAVFAANGSEGTILYVKTSPTGMGNCTSWENACELQTALSLARETPAVNQIWVAAGIYKPTTTYNEDISFRLVDGVEIYGGFPMNGGNWESRNWGDHFTALSGNIGDTGKNTDNSWHVVIADELNTPAVLDGFTISDGYVIGVPSDWGAGLLAYRSDVIIRNVIFHANTADMGGGIYSYESDLELENVTIWDNNAETFGGGMYIISGSPTLTAVSFTGNAANDGGGMFINSGSSTLENVSFTDNSAVNNGGGIHGFTSTTFTMTNSTVSNNTAGGCGGGIYNNDYSSPVISRVTFSGNMASSGAGMYNDLYAAPLVRDSIFSSNIADERGGGMYNGNHSAPTLSNLTFSGNEASYSGGGVYSDQSTFELTNATFYDNYGSIGGGMLITYGSVTLTNVTFFNNWGFMEGGGLWVYESDTVITNGIFWGNRADFGSQVFGLCTVTFSDFEYGHPGEGNIDQDPLLESLADNGGFTPTHALLSGSPAIDAGSMTVCPSVDQRGFPRPIDGNGDGAARCDMGAYEAGSGYFLYLPLILN